MSDLTPEELEAHREAMDGRELSIEITTSDYDSLKVNVVVKDILTGTVIVDIGEKTIDHPDNVLDVANVVIERYLADVCFRPCCQRSKNGYRQSIVEACSYMMRQRIDGE